MDTAMVTSHKKPNSIKKHHRTVTRLFTFQHAMANPAILIKHTTFSFFVVWETLSWWLQISIVLFDDQLTQNMRTWKSACETNAKFLEKYLLNWWTETTSANGAASVCLYSVFTKEKERWLLYNSVWFSVFWKLEKLSTPAFQLQPKTLLMEL